MSLHGPGTAQGQSLPWVHSAPVIFGRCIFLVSVVSQLPLNSLPHTVAAYGGGLGPHRVPVATHTSGPIQAASLLDGTHCPRSIFLKRSAQWLHQACSHLFQLISVIVLKKHLLFYRCPFGGAFRIRRSDEEVHFYTENHVAVLGSCINQVKVSQVPAGWLYRVGTGGLEARLS